MRLLTRSSRVAAARAQAQQVNLELLWAEWQTVAQARLLFDQVATLRAKQARLRRECEALRPIAVAGAAPRCAPATSPTTPPAAG